jgi:hypothetical protein
MIQYSWLYTIPVYCHLQHQKNDRKANITLKFLLDVGDYIIFPRLTPNPEKKLALTLLRLLNNRKELRNGKRFT